MTARYHVISCHYGQDTPDQGSDADWIGIFKDPLVEDLTSKAFGTWIYHRHHDAGFATQSEAELHLQKVTAGQGGVREAPTDVKAAMADLGVMQVFYLGTSADHTDSIAIPLASNAA
ncbi:MAG: hypothetical protein ACPGOY_01085 [Rhodospirillaceae bacterium]